MKLRYLGLVAVLILPLAACGTKPAQIELAGCSTFYSLVDVATSLNNDGKLSTKEVGVVDEAVAAGDPICKNMPTDLNADAQTIALNAAIDALTGIKAAHTGE